MSENAIVRLYLKAEVEPDDGMYHSWCPQLKGCHSCGETEKEALKNARDAAIAYIRSLVKHGEPLPKDTIVTK